MKTTKRMAPALSMLAALGWLAGCDGLDGTGLDDDLDPRDLQGRYTWVLQTWSEGRSVGYPLVELTWELPFDYRDEVFRVYARGSRGGGYDLIATVTSCTDGLCRYGDSNVRGGESYDYYVATVDDWDGDEIGASRDVTVDVPEVSSVTIPDPPVTVGLDGAVFLRWTATGAARYVVLAQADDGEIFMIGESDGTSFLDDRAENGTRYRYYLAAVDEDDHVSSLSPAVEAIPRPDFHADIVYAYEDDAGASGFRFVTSETQDPIVAGSAANAQWRLEASGGALFLRPLGQTRISAGEFTTELTCGPGSESNCEDVGTASNAALSTASVTVETGFTYVLRVIGDDGRVHYAKLRVQGSSVDTQGRRLVVFDWAYQLRPEEPRLQVAGG